MNARIAYLPDRGVVEITGADRVAFLQGLVSNDTGLAGPDTLVWAALLTPQGKWLADFFIAGAPDRLLLDCEREQAPMLAERLRRFRLRMNVDVADRSDAFAVSVAWGGTPGAAMGWRPDPRLPAAGWRLLAPAPFASNADPSDWDRHRLALGLPDGTRDMEAGKSTLLEGGFDELHGVSWTKGCYMGQELTARTKYRGLLKRRLVPVNVDGALPEPGTAVTRAGAQVGTMRSGRDGRGLALLQLDALDAPLTAAAALLRPDPPDWMTLSGRPAGQGTDQPAILTT